LAIFVDNTYTLYIFFMPETTDPGFPACIRGQLEIIDSGAGTAAHNMLIDEQRAHACAAGEASPLLRLYAWQPWAVSLGANQRETDIDPQRCAERGFDLVRRPTGGRAILHADELTYCVVTPLADGQTVHDLYRDIHLLLRDALVSLGAIGLDFEKSQPDFRALYKSSTRSLPCFSSAARYELQWHGRKLVGSAQRRYGTVVLQHGSILLGSGHEQLADVATLASEEERKTMRSTLLNQTTTLHEICGRTISYEECSAAIVRQVGMSALI
jgi:lipoate-protein ligase A